MNDAQKMKLIEEHNYVDKKLIKLQAFILDGKPEGVSEKMYSLLWRQLRAMNEYTNCLLHRMQLDFDETRETTKDARN